MEKRRVCGPQPTNKPILSFSVFHDGKTSILSFIGVKVDRYEKALRQSYAKGKLTIQINQQPAAVRSS
jgi:hypothetical protein